MMYVKTKTLNDIISEGTEIFPSVVPYSLRNTIIDWYGLRKVCDDENFPRYFRRVLNRDYHRYNEQLRIEAGAGINVAGYDWLVNRYLEREVKTDGTRNIENDIHEVMGGTITDTTTPRATTETTSETTYGKTDTLEYGKKDEFSHGHVIQFDPHSHRFSKQGETVETTDEKTDGVAGASSNATSTGKTTPASVLGTYSDGTETAITRWEGSITSSLGKTTAWDNELNSPTSISKAVNNSLSKTAGNNFTTREFIQETEDETYGTGTDETRNTGKDTSQLSGEDIRELGGKDTTVVSEVKAGEDTNEKLYDTEKVITGGIERTIDDTVHEIYTGREGENMATALTKAREYIQTTSAWEWLQKQLEPCFMGVYDI